VSRRRRLDKTRRGLLLDHEHDDAMDLQIGVGPGCPPDEVERLREVYFQHRAEVLEGDGPHPGHRPWAWWKWESGIEHRPGPITNRAGYIVVTAEAAETDWLRKNGHLTAWEERELRKQRNRFAKAPAAGIELEGDSA
jgi:hypothetical protein